MNRRAFTKEERFLLALCDEKEEEIDPVEVGQKIRIAKRGVRAICQTFIRSNFLRKCGEERVALTEWGRKVAQSLK